MKMRYNLISAQFLKKELHLTMSTLIWLRRSRQSTRSLGLKK